MSRLTEHGFVFEHLEVTRMWRHKGASMVRVLNTRNGQYVDVQTTPKGKKTRIKCGHLSATELADKEGK